MLLLAGTTIYLTRNPPYEFYIRPGQVLLNDILYVKYDVKVGTNVVVPKGTMVKGDWITEVVNTTTVAAQLQTRSIALYGINSELNAHSPASMYETTDLYNKQEIENAPYLYKEKSYRSDANIVRRLVNVNCKNRVLLDSNPTSPYIRVPTEEIPITLTSDF
jgi:hypothetical protein